LFVPVKFGAAKFGAAKFEAVMFEAVMFGSVRVQAVSGIIRTPVVTISVKFVKSWPLGTTI
jgi:hypothetical protein